MQIANCKLKVRQGSRQLDGRACRKLLSGWHFAFAFWEEIAKCKLEIGISKLKRSDGIDWALVQRSQMQARRVIRASAGRRCRHHFAFCNVAPEPNHVRRPPNISIPLILSRYEGLSLRAADRRGLRGRRASQSVPRLFHRIRRAPRIHARRRPAYLDWKVLGRSDRYCLKQFEEETNLVCNLLLDTGESMTYQSPRRRCRSWNMPSAPRPRWPI